jgi:hypothetical protein
VIVFGRDHDEGVGGCEPFPGRGQRGPVLPAVAEQADFKRVDDVGLEPAIGLDLPAHPIGHNLRHAALARAAENDRDP